jgi:prolipoprotein diacylglyceryltransferase
MGLRAEVWNSRRGGWSVFGALLMFPFALLLPPLVGTSALVFWDHMAAGLPVAGAFIRFGCICNGCCVGRESRAWFALRQHDVNGVYRRRVPVQWLEIGWWLLGGVGLIWLWSKHLPPGSYLLGVLAWYGVGRFWLEPLREAPDLIRGRVRLDRVVAALLAIVAGAGLVRLAMTAR